MMNFVLREGLVSSIKTAMTIDNDNGLHRCNKQDKNIDEKPSSSHQLSFEERQILQTEHFFDSKLSCAVDPLCFHSPDAYMAAKCIGEWHYNSNGGNLDKLRFFFRNCLADVPQDGIVYKQLCS